MATRVLGSYICITVYFVPYRRQTIKSKLTCQTKSDSLDISDLCL
jgi:hypothetical protein